MFDSKLPELSFLLVLWPLLIGIISIFINLIIMVRHKINKAVQRITGQKVVTTTVSFIIIFGIIM